MTFHRDIYLPPLRWTRALAVLALLALVPPDPAWAGDAIFGTDSPLTKFVDFVTGPFAYLVVIVALVATVGVLALGGEFSGFSRRMPIVVVAGGIVILSQTVLGTLFGSTRAANWTPDPAPRVERIETLPEPDARAQTAPPAATPSGTGQNLPGVQP